MSISNDLSSWGEPAAESTEELLASFVETVIGTLDRGEHVDADELLLRFAATAEILADGRRDDCIDQARELIVDVQRLHFAATSVWEHSGLIDPDLANSTDLQRHQVSAGNDEHQTLPDPFPDEFRIVQKLGQGTFGEVWLAEDLNLGWQVALKTVRCHQESAHAPRALEALRNEAKLLATVRHPNVVQVYAWRQSEEQAYVVLQYIEGGSFETRVKEQGTLSWDRAARYIADVSEGLLKVHECGIIHRDIKPANILWDTRTDEALLTDFGLSTRLGEARELAGTPAYMAPEVFTGCISYSSDVYSLAASLFYLLAAEVPFPSKSWQEQLKLIEAGPLQSDDRWSVIPEALDEIIRSGLAPDPQKRPSLAEFTESLRQSLNQLMADSLNSPPHAGQSQSINLRIQLNRYEYDGSLRPVATTNPRPVSVSRDMRKVPPCPQKVELRTGDRLRIELASDKEGYVTLFNVGPTGNMNFLYPEDLSIARTDPDVVAGRPLLVVDDVQMCPPAGSERLFAVWTRNRIQLSDMQLMDIADRARIPVSQSYRATRDMKRICETLHQLEREDWHAVVLELHHA